MTVTDFNNLVQEFWRTLRRDGADGTFFFALLLLFSCGSSAIAASSDYIRGKFKILLDGFRKMFDLLFSNSKDLNAMFRLLPGVVAPHQVYYSSCTAKSIPFPLRIGRLSVWFLQDRDRSITAISCFNTFLFAVNFRLYWMDPMPLTFSHDFRVSSYVGSHFYQHLFVATLCTEYLRRPPCLKTSLRNFPSDR